MFYYLQYLAGDWWACLSVFKSVTFRAAFAAVTAFIICVTLGGPFIRYLISKQKLLIYNISCSVPIVGCPIRRSAIINALKSTCSRSAVIFGCVSLG